MRVRESGEKQHEKGREKENTDHFLLFDHGLAFLALPRSLADRFGHEF